MQHVRTFVVSMCTLFTESTNYAISEIEQSHYRPGQAQRVPGS